MSFWGMPSALWVIRVTRLLAEDGKRIEERRRDCLVARIHGRRQQRIWFIMASLTVSLSPLVSSFLSSLSLFHGLSPSSTLISVLSISTGLLTGPVWLIWILAAGISKGYDLLYMGVSDILSSVHREQSLISFRLVDDRTHIGSISFCLIGQSLVGLIRQCRCGCSLCLWLCMFTLSCISSTNMNVGACWWTCWYWFPETWSTSGCENPQGQIEYEEEGARGHVREGDKRKIEGHI